MGLRKVDLYKCTKQELAEQAVLSLRLLNYMAYQILIACYVGNYSATPTIPLGAIFISAETNIPNYIIKATQCLLQYSGSL